jgi:hypothetical protein
MEPKDEIEFRDTEYCRFKFLDLKHKENCHGA